MSVLQFGLGGGAVGAGLLLPQYLLYFPAQIYFMRKVFHMSMQIWKSHGLFPAETGKYLLSGLLTGGLYLGGILLEVYCNPWTVRLLTRILNI